MKLEEAKAAFYKASDTLSENIRKLLLAGIAIIWIFRVGDKSAAGIAFSKTLLLPLGAFVLGLLLDLLQYLYKTIAWWLFYDCKHKQGIKDDAEVSAPSMINVPAFIFFYAKQGACGYGFFYLLVYIANALWA